VHVVREVGIEALLREVSAARQPCTPGEGLARLAALRARTQAAEGGLEAGVECASSWSQPLICPITCERLCVPARGRACQHFRCFELEAYLVSTSRAVFHQRWRCPLCSVWLPPRDLLLCGLTQRLLEGGDARVTEVPLEGFQACSCGGLLTSVHNFCEQCGLPRQACEVSSAPPAVAAAPPPPLRLSVPSSPELRAAVPVLGGVGAQGGVRTPPPRGGLALASAASSSKLVGGGPEQPSSFSSSTSKSATSRRRPRWRAGVLKPSSASSTGKCGSPGKKGRPAFRLGRQTSWGVRLRGSGAAVTSQSSPLRPLVLDLAPSQ